LEEEKQKKKRKKYGTLKPVKVTSRRGRGKREKRNQTSFGSWFGMNQTRIHCTHRWKCHSETSCTTIIY
jgi:hypothetical protein